MDADVDSQGNIVVVGATFQTTIKAASTRTIQASVNERAFISRNPMGRISLDVLPRTPLRIKVAGTNGVPSTGVGAVSMNVTVTSPDGEGFITVYPCDSKPDASNLNYTLDQTVPNAVIATYFTFVDWAQTLGRTGACVENARWTSGCKALARREVAVDIRE